MTGTPVHALLPCVTHVSNTHMPRALGPGVSPLTSYPLVPFVCAQNGRLVYQQAGTPTSTQAARYNYGSLNRQDFAYQNYLEPANVEQNAYRLITRQLNATQEIMGLNTSIYYNLTNPIRLIPTGVAMAARRNLRNMLSQPDLPFVIRVRLDQLLTNYTATFWWLPADDIQYLGCFNLNLNRPEFTGLRNGADPRNRTIVEELARCGEADGRERVVLLYNKANFTGINSRAACMLAADNYTLATNMTFSHLILKPEACLGVVSTFRTDIVPFSSQINNNPPPFTCLRWTQAVQCSAYCPGNPRDVCGGAVDREGDNGAFSVYHIYSSQYPSNRR